MYEKWSAFIIDQSNWKWVSVSLPRNESGTGAPQRMCQCPISAILEGEFCLQAFLRVRAFGLVPFELWVERRSQGEDHLPFSFKPKQPCQRPSLHHLSSHWLLYTSVHLYYTPLFRRPAMLSFEGGSISIPSKPRFTKGEENGHLRKQP